MPKDQILNSLEIQRFRCFRELRIEHLGRVNLIVGKNNVGKSTLLEALRLFARPASFADLLEIFAARNEIAGLDFQHGEFDVEELPFRKLFFGRMATISDSFTIGPANRPEETLEIALAYRDTYREVDQKFVDIHREEIAKLNSSIIFILNSEFQLLTSSRPVLHKIHRETASGGKQIVTLEPITGTLRNIPFHSVGPDGLRSEDVAKLWDEVSLSPLEQEVITAMRIISPEVERVAMRPPDVWPRDGQYRNHSESRVAFVKIECFDSAIPLRELGDGVNRLFGIALALVHAKDGLLLIDEIENGIHYSVQADLWRLVFQTATRLNVQVFATTHSYDCIKAFEEAARESEEEGVLVRLARKGDRTLVGVFDERELEIAVEGEIEVR
jgi:ABC-type branched-subunit amino acid transport system ATPase component